MRKESAIFLVCGVIATLIFLTAVHANEPLENALVWLEWTDGKHNMSNATFTDVNGYYEMNVAEGTVNLTAIYNKTKGNELIFIYNSTENFYVSGVVWKNITLHAFPEDSATISGHVYDNVTKLPIVNANVSISFEDDYFAGFNHTFTDSNGYYVIHLPASNVTVVASADGYYTGVNATVVITSKTIDFYLDPLPPTPPITAVVKGYITDQTTDDPVEGANVSIFGVNITYYNFTTTGIDGYYEFNVPAGNFSIYVDVENYFPAYPPPFEVNESETKWMNVSLVPHPPDEAWVDGFVTDSETGSPIANANVTVTGTIMIGLGGLADTYVRNTVTDSNGYYNVSVPASYPGWGIPQYSIVNSASAEAEGYFSNSTSIPYPANMPLPGQTLRLNITLDAIPPEDCIVKGYIYIESAPAPPAPKILYVGGSGEGNYTSIQDAINAASEGDIIFVYSGVYRENIVINKSITLMGENKNTAIIDGNYSGDVVKITANGVKIEKFTIEKSDWQSNAGVNISASNCIIANSIIQKNQYGVYSFSCNNTIINCDFLNNDRGIYFDYYKNGSSYIYSHNNIINGCYISNSSYGIYFRCSHNNTIEKCTILNSSRGIFFHTPNTALHFSSNNVISNCTILNNYFGIEFSLSCNNIITGCNLSNNDYAGLSFSYSDNNIINNSNIFNNEWYGIKLFYSDTNTISANIISNNYYGVYTTSSGMNLIYHNNFVNNTQQAYDESINKWDNGYPSGGNYWSDFDDPAEGAYDNNRDGIVDSPYTISGSNQDEYPLLHPYGSIINQNNNKIFLTIQDAINAASNGDTIKVYPGTYDGPIIINKEIKLIGDPAIDGHGGYGIKIEANNTLVENFTVFNCSTGIYARNFSFTLNNITIRNCTAYDCANYGTHIHYADEIYIENNTIYNSSMAGLVLWDINGGDIKNNEIFNSGNALSLLGCSNLMIYKNLIHGNSGDGIYLSGNSIHNEITWNWIYDNAGYHGGIYVYYSHYNEIKDNYVYNNSKYGIYLKNARNNTISYNIVYGNGYDGIYVMQDAINNSILSNVIYNNSQAGINVYSSNNTIKYNHVYNNQNGIVIRDTSSNNSIILNKIDNNGLYGIYLIGNNNTVRNNPMVYNYYGIYLMGKNNTILSNDINGGGYGIYVQEIAEGNEIKNNQIKDSSYELQIYGQHNIFINNTINSTKFSFTYKGNLTIKDASPPSSLPPHWHSIDKFLEISKIDAMPAWLNLTIYYEDSDVAGLLEDTLKIWKWDGSWYEDGWNGSRYLDMANNAVGVNITSFSIFAPLAMIPNHLPYATNPSPANGSVDVSTNPTLSVVVYDEDGDTMNVSFYNASNDALIGYVNGISSGSIASIVWHNLAYNTTYYWYVIVNDSYGENKSDVWHFKTIIAPSIVYVDDDYNGSTPGWNVTHFNKIQDGIDAVAENGVVYVYEGVYKENIVISKSIRLLGEDKNIVIIEGDATGDVVNISANHVNISGFTVKNSSLEPLEPFSAGIKVYHASYVKISSCLLSNNYAGILLLNSSNVNVTNNIVTDNEIDIMLQNSNYNTIFDNDCFHGNEGMWLSYSDNNSILNNNCSDNDVGIVMEYSNNNIISHCILDNLDGLNIFHSYNNTISRCTISNNLLGIKIETNSANNSILYCTISNNDIGISIYNAENTSVYYCNIINNLNGTVVSGSRYCEIHYNNIHGNKYYGVMNLHSDVKYLVEATRNYWGSASGPYHPVQNPDGKGDNITDNILFIPWFSSPIKIALEKSIHVGENIVNALNETDVHVVINAIKRNVIRVISFEGAPVEEYPASVGKYVDINVENSSAVDWPIFIKFYYTQDDLSNAGLTEDELVGLYFYNESIGKWQLFNDTGVNTTDVVINGKAYAGYAWANAWHFTVITAGSTTLPSVVYVDDDWAGSSNGDAADGHTFGYDAFATIPDAINGVAEKGTIYVYEGVYEGSVAINKQVSIVSLGNPRNTIIKASGENAITMHEQCLLDGFTIRDAYSSSDNVRGIWVKADGCVIRNVTIMNITAEQNDSIYIYTYGIMINYADNCTLENITIYDIKGNDSTAYGIYAYESDNTSFSNITIFNVTSVSTAYGICYSYGSNSEILYVNVSIINGSGRYGINFYKLHNVTLEYAIISTKSNGYGVRVSESSYISIENCSAKEEFYGIILDKCNNSVVRNSSLYDNMHGITLWTNCYHVTIENNNISNNTYSGVYLYQSNEFNSITRNKIYENDDNGVYIRYSGNNMISWNHIYSNGLHGITIWGENNTISSNYIYNNSGDGVLVSLGENNIVSGNYIYNNTYGIYLSNNANNNTILSNHIYNDSNDGIKIYSNDNNVSSNYIYNSWYGISISSGSNNTLYSNYIYSNKWGILLSISSSNNTILSNYIFNNSYDGIRTYSNNNNISFNHIYNNSNYGILISSGSNNTVYANYIYNNGWDGIRLSEYASNNTLLSNYIYNNSYDGVKLYYYTSHNIIKNNYIYNNSNGIRINYMNHTHNIIENNHIYNNINNGIYSDAFAINNIISGNEVYGNGEKGIFLLRAENNLVANNTCYNNKWGIVLQDGANNNTVANNTNYENLYYGILIQSSMNNVITSNKAYNNSAGIALLQSSQNNTISSNYLTGNNYGIYITSSNNNTIYNNYFNNTINAYDNGYNIWNISKMAGKNILGGSYLGGNYWHDYNGNDTNGDDLGDTMVPYNSNGNILHGGDWLPLLIPTNHPPATPYTPSPPNGAAGIDLDVTLSWYCSDPDGDALSYDVYFGLSSLALEKKAGNITATSYHVGILQHNTTYYWRIVAWDENGAKSIGPIWHFTTKENSPPTVTNPHPANGSVGVRLGATLAVDVSDADGDKLAVTFYDASDDSVIGMVEEVSSGETASIVWRNLDYGTTYYWYVKVSDGITTVTSPVWHFTTREKQQFTLVTSVEPSNAGYISLNPAGGIYDEGTVVILQATANEGYVFSYWSGDASGTNPTVQIIMNGNKNVVAHFVAISENHPPVVEILSPQNGSTVSGTITIQGKATDEDGNETLQKVEIRVDGGEWKVADGTTLWSYSWDTTKVANGLHEIEVRSYDGTDYSDIAKVIVNVQNVANNPPSVQITAPANGSTVKGSIIIKGKASDIDGNETLQKVEIRIDGQEWKEAKGTTNWAYTLDTTKLSNGEHTIEVRAYDGIEYSNIISIKIDVQNEKAKGIPWMLIGGMAIIIAIVIIAVWLIRKK